MGENMWEGIVAIVVVAALFANAMLNRRAQRRRMELIHQERLAAMDKGIPLPEFPVDPPPTPPTPADERLPLLFGILLLACGLGGVIALMVVDHEKLRQLWSLPFPVALMGLGLILYHYLTRDRKH